MKEHHKNIVEIFGPKLTAWTGDVAQITWPF